MTKGLLTFSLFLSISLNLLGQSSKIDVKSNLDLVEGQQVTSFIILEKKKEAFLDNCFTKWKNPVENSVGIVKWMSIDIPSIGDSLTIKLLDGYVTKVGNFKRVDKFKSAEEKKAMVKNMSKDQERFLSITFFDKNGMSVSWTQDKLKIMTDYLTDLLKSTK